MMKINRTLFINYYLEVVLYAESKKLKDKNFS